MAQKQDFFTTLGGRVKFTRGTYNPTCDAVWLAAFAAGNSPLAGESARAKRKPVGGYAVLDAGVGTGGASLCLLEHSSDLKITGIDISEQMLAEAGANACLNGRDMEFIHGDIFTWRTNRTFDIVVTNPPYFKGTPRTGNPHHNIDLTLWTRACLKHVRPDGYFYCIVDAAATAEVGAALHSGRAGDINIVPLFGGAKTAERVLISARLGSRGGTKIHAGLSMNDDKILRDGELITINRK